MKKTNPPSARSDKRKAPQTAPSARPDSLSIPPILLEDDDPDPAVSRAPSDSAEPLRLLLLPRDPHHLYAHWDLPAEQSQKYLAAAAGASLVLKIYQDNPTSTLDAELRLSPGSEHQFIHVSQPGTNYIAELGYQTNHGTWVSLAISQHATTPPDRVAEMKTPQFVTREAAATPPTTASLQSQASQAHLQEAIPEVTVPPRVGWIPQLGIAPAAFSTTPSASEKEPGYPSADQPMPAELLPHAPSEFPGQISPLDLSSLEWIPSLGASSWFSAPQEGHALPLDVDTDLILYGLTDPHAQLLLEGQPIEINPDGTFSCRLALPEGAHELTITAISAQGENRHARFKLQRQSL